MALVLNGNDRLRGLRHRRTGAFPDVCFQCNIAFDGRGFCCVGRDSGFRICSVEVEAREVRVLRSGVVDDYGEEGIGRYLELCRCFVFLMISCIS
ncbi:hypothetical protein Scep_021526 [Stephania cephalantha]|uniref:Uncharacterized protein n=1 Tax=Stephania cephalantha TaxID=152367 RepID=A0AAP0I0A8_9MAGN